MPIGRVLRAGRGLARLLNLDNEAMLDRIDGGFAFRAPGIGIAILRDRLLVHLWDHPTDELHAAHAFAELVLGVELPLHDARIVKTAAETVSSGSEQWPLDPAVGDVSKDASDETMDGDPVPNTAPSTANDDDCDPGM